MDAAKEGGKNGISRLEELRGARHPLEAPDYDGRTVFHVAAAEFNVDVLAYLFNQCEFSNLDKLKVNPTHLL